MDPVHWRRLHGRRGTPAVVQTCTTPRRPRVADADITHLHASGYEDAGAGGFGSDSDAEPARDDGEEAEQGADEGHPASGAWDVQPGSHAQGRQQEGGGAASTVDWLIQSAKLGGAVTRGRGWAGATHWRYSAAAGDASQEATAAKKPAKCDSGISVPWRKHRLEFGPVRHPECDKDKPAHVVLCPCLAVHSFMPPCGGIVNQRRTSMQNIEIKPRQCFLSAQEGKEEGRARLPEPAAHTAGRL